jgi:CheY-like chemotaxis protein
MAKKILLIESDGAFAQELADALEARGLQARVTGDGKEGLDLAKVDRPDCIVLCVELPKMSGYSICNKLKKDDQLKTIPLVIISAEATSETFDQHRKLKTRAEEYLIKPFGAATLLQKLAGLVELPPEPEAAEEMVTLDEVTLEDVEELDAGAGLAAAADAAVEEDDDLKLLDDAFENLASPDPTTMITALTDGASAERAATPAPEPEPEPEALGLSADADGPSEVDRLGDEADAALAALGADDDLDLAAAAEALLDEELPPAPAPPTVDRTAELAAVAERANGFARELEQARAEAREQGRRAGAELAAAEERLRAAEERLRAAEAGASAHARRAEAVEESARATVERTRAAEERAIAAEEGTRAAAARAEAAEEQLAEARRELDASRHEAARVAGEAAQARERAEELGRELGAANSRASGFESELGALRPQLATLQGELAEARTVVESSRADSERAAGELAKRVAELEALLAKHEDRVVKAYQKIKNDEKIREKTRKALTIALQLLEERGPNGSAPDVQPRKE